MEKTRNPVFAGGWWLFKKMKDRRIAHYLTNFI